LLLGEVSGIIAAGVAALLSLAVTLLEAIGLLPVETVVHSPLIFYLSLFWAVFAVAGVQYMFSREVKSALARVQEELQQRERRETFFRAVVENSSEAVVFLDSDFTVTYATPALPRVGGWTPEEVVGTSAPMYVHPDDLFDFDRRVRESLDVPNAKVRHEGRYRHKQGHWVWVETEVTNLLHDPDVRALVVNLRNINDRILADEALRNREAYIRALIDNTPDIIAGFDREGRYLFVNRSVSKVSNALPEEHIGKRIGDIPGFTPEIAAWRRDIVKKVYATGKPFEGEFQSQIEDGGLTFEWRVLPVQDSDGNILSVFSINRDITERKKTVLALHDSMEQLHDLSSQLEHAREQERKSTAREVHDELGQILTAIRMGIERAGVSKRTRPALDGHEMKMLLNLVDRGIDAVRRIAARLRPGVLDDLGLIAALEWRVEEFQEQSGLACTLSLPDVEPVVDDRRSTTLYRILGELLTNVGRHAHATGVHVTLSEQKEEFFLSVQDNGVGISGIKARNPHALGFKGIKERLYPFGGSLEVQPGPAGGTEVMIHLPKHECLRRNNYDHHPDR
jgi:PAS domain S-box-containing protein